MSPDIQEARYDSRRHPSDEELIHYLGGRLEEATSDTLQAHLVDCDQCLATFKDARDFFDSHRESERMISEDIAQESRTFWNRINAERDANDPSTERSRSGFRLSPALGFVAAILLVAVVIGILAIRQRQEKRQLAGQLEAEQQRTAQLENEQQNLANRVKELEQENLNLQERPRAVQQSDRSLRGEAGRPELNVPIYDLYSTGFIGRSGDNSDVNRINVPPAVRSMILILNGEGVPRFSRYAIEIVGADGRVVWRGGGLKKGSDGNFTMTLDPAFLDKETSRVKLYGPASQQLAQYLVRIE